MPATRTPIKTPGRGPTGPGGRRPLYPLSSFAYGVGKWQPVTPATLTTIRYVRKTGSDSNGGTSPSDAWLTINKALTTASPGTVIYVGAGTYRELVSITITPTSSLPVALVGDVDGAFTGDVGPVILSSYLTTDRVAPSGTTLFNLNGKSNMTFQRIMFVQGSAAVVTASSSTRIAFLDCAFLGDFVDRNPIFSVTGTYGLKLSWLIDRCAMIGTLGANSGMIVLTTPGIATGQGDYDLDFTVRNTYAEEIGGATNAALIRLVNAVTTNRPGGIVVRNCTLFGLGVFVSSNASNLSIQVFSYVMNSLIVSGTIAWINVGTANAVVEDYNVVLGAANGGSALNSGGHSSLAANTFAPLFHFGQETIWQGQLRPRCEPMAGSPLLAFGADGYQIGTDLRGGPRPTGLVAPAPGALERGNNFTQETVTFQSGPNAVSLVGDGFHDFLLPVDAGTVTVSVYCRIDSNYQGQPPRLQIIPNEQIGIGDPCAWGTSAGLNAFEQLAVQITPTAKGYVTVRVIASDVTNSGQTIFDSWAVS